MTNEELIEEILYEAHALGVYREVIELSEIFKEKDRVDRLQKALFRIKSNLNITCDKFED
jgi:cyanophycinase-like exopeptidase